MRLRSATRQQPTSLQSKISKTFYKRRINRGHNQPLFINLPDMMQVNAKEKRSTEKFPKVIQQKRFKQVRHKIYNDSINSQRVSHSLSSLKLKKSSNKSYSRQKQYKNQCKLQIQNGRILNIIYIYLDGLKYNTKQAFITIKPQYELKDNYKKFLLKIQKMILLQSKHIYLFHLNGQPISSVSQIHRLQYSIFVDRFPKLNIPQSLQYQLNQKIKLIQNSIKEVQKQRTQSYQLHKQHCVSVLELADHLILDPFNPIQIQNYYNKNRSKQFQKQTDFITNQHEFESKKTKTKLNDYEQTNPFNFLTSKSSQFKSKSKMQRNYQSLDIKKSYSVNLKSNKFLKRFPSPSLNFENIPQLIMKYNLSRFDIINLHSLYKTLISITQQKNLQSKNTIDLKTLQKGLFGAGINIGKQAISSACLDNNNISWLQFLKVVSISSCKTPEQKLQNIIQSVIQKDSQCQYLNHSQIDFIIHSFLTKLLQKVDKSLFDQLKQYLHKTVLLDLDPTNKGIISIQALKSKILKQKKQNDLTTFIFLHS